MNTRRQDSYDEAFYDEIGGGAETAASVAVPLLMELIEPASVLDVGCGDGTWLAAFARHGVTDILGLDGHRLGADALAIPDDAYRTVDLTQSPQVERTFDLAISLEVGEHLPAQSASGLVDMLCAAAPVVAFSAAVPGQGGVHHVNEQWPHYWAELFAARDRCAVDVLRPALWGKVTPANYYYAQNLVLYVTDDVVTDRARFNDDGTAPPSLIHPLHLEALALRRTAPTAPSLSRLLRQLPRATADAVRHRLTRSRR